MRIKDSVPFARRSLRRGDKVSVRFVTDIFPAKVVSATDNIAVVKLFKVKDGQPDERSSAGEFALRFVRNDAAVVGLCSGAWRVAGMPALAPDAGIVYKGFNLANA